MTRSTPSRKIAIRYLIRFGAVAFWILLWQILSLLVGKEVVLPSPVSVLKSLGKLLATPPFYQAILRSFSHIVSGFLWGMLFGCALAFLSHLTHVCHALFAPILVIIRATPVASFILMAMVWLKTEQIPILVTALMVLPLFYANVGNGLRELDRDLLEMLSVYRVPFWKRFRFFYFPSLMPYFSACAVTGFGLAWKAGIAAEVIALPRGSLGRYLYESKLYLETASLFASTIVVILCSVLCESGLRLLLHRFLERAKGVKEKKEGSHE